MFSRARFVKLSTRILLTVPFLLGGLIALEIMARWMKSDSMLAQPQPCLRWNLPIMDHRYMEDCTSEMEYNGKTIKYRFNHDGLRERELEEFTDPLIAVMGDSTVKGLYLEPEETISRRLEERVGKAIGFQFVNLGLRFSSPTVQAHLLNIRLTNYPFKGVLWFLNGTDPVEERFFYSIAKERDGRGFPLTFEEERRHKFFFGALSAFMSLVPGNWEIVEALRRYFFYEDRYASVVNVAANRRSICSGIGYIRRRFVKQGLPVMFVFTPHPEAGIGLTWPKNKVDQAQIDLLVECARVEGTPVLDIRQPVPSTDLYFTDQLHYRPDGVNWLVDRIAKPVTDFLLTVPH